MKVSGKMTYSTEGVWKLGLMDQDTTETMLLEGNMESVHTSGMMGLSTREIGKKTKLVGWESIRGSMEGSTKESGKIITWRD
jgi:hypothetical protein